MSDPTPVDNQYLNPFVRHMALYQTDAVAAHDWDGSHTGNEGTYPTLFLTTIGRKSGNPRSLPLLYQPCGEGFLIVASKGGKDTNPVWYENLLANPSCEVVAGSLSCKATAHTVPDDKRDLYWDWMTRFWPSYIEYQSKTERKIPLVILAIDEVKLVSNRIINIA